MEQYLFLIKNFEIVKAKVIAFYESLEAVKEVKEMLVN